MDNGLSVIAAVWGGHSEGRAHVSSVAPGRLAVPSTEGRRAGGTQRRVQLRVQMTLPVSLPVSSLHGRQVNSWGQFCRTARHGTWERLGLS